MNELNTLTGLSEMSDERLEYLLSRRIVRRDLVRGGYSHNPGGPVQPDDFEALVSLSETHWVGTPDQRPRFVCSFVTWDRHIILVRKTHPAWQSGRLNGVGGMVEAGETSAEAAVREWEETGLPGRNLLSPFLDLHDDRSVVHFYRGAYPREFPVMAQVARSNTRPEKIVVMPLDNPVWMDPQHAIDNLSWLIPMSISDVYHTGGTVWGRTHD